MVMVMLTMMTMITMTTTKGDDDYDEDGADVDYNEAGVPTGMLRYDDADCDDGDYVKEPGVRLRATKCPPAAS